MASAALRRDRLFSNNTHASLAPPPTRDGDYALDVRVEYRLRGASYEVLVRRDDGALVCAATAETPRGALEASAAVLALCSDARYRLTELVPFPWAAPALGQ